ncbi:MAG: tRNA (N(6)-L-threonylcarbamoyladenosine(37)-C(2))-methylthiotransferase MtaB [Bacteroidales bacterium]|nr:tRNA (N(6)-L-threonylcarbamoyladenosine(37)-C(2))-methylthiotransferase MtaB [Bacteroidales bacterium]
MRRKVAFKTLGCRLNQFETDSLLTDFYKADYEIVNFTEKADVYIINTCTVTSQSDRKSKTYINQAARNSHNPLVIVTGCLATSQKEYLEDRGDIVYVVENPNKSQLFTLVEAHFTGDILHPFDLKQDLFNFTVAEKSFHTRSMIKIQDGCDNFCSYCIVPFVRGRAVSRPVDDIVHHVQQMVSLGFKEVVLTGVNISRYWYEGTDFEGLLEKIVIIPGDFRVRISSIEPEALGERLVDLFSYEKLCPHLHLCIQSGSDRILQKMARMYTVSDYYALSEKLRRRCPLFNLTTDVIVGFPGETDRDFDETCRVIRDIGFSHVHTFKYSVRKGTRAEKMPDHVHEKIKSERSEIVRKISDENKLKYYTCFIGKRQNVLVEKITRQGFAKGFGEYYLPVEFKSGRNEHNYFAEVVIKELSKATRPFVLSGTRAGISAY